ncbi:MAG: hypothetical protein KAR20_16880, partial [Candidatus Heimdallarchaeota archaeon]|nr:hypothetical protein [Candidatus Heimdallarchaeota archaeon]
YHNCISRLSLIIASRSDKIKISDEAQINLNQEALEWLSLLSLHQRSLYEKKEYNFHNRFQDFTEDPQSEADILLQEVYKLAMTDKTLFPDVEPTKEDPDERRVQIRIDDNFRREQILEGIELPKDYIFYCNLSKLTRSQREKLWDINEERKNIPSRFTLSLPSFNSNIKKVVLKGSGIWACKMNPFKVPPEEIFNAWERDYKKSFLQAQRDLEGFIGDTH